MLLPAGRSVIIGVQVALPPCLDRESRPMPPVARHVLGIAAMITNRRMLAREL